MLKAFFQNRRERKKALQAAGTLFQQEYPTEELCGYIGRVKYEEANRYIVEVCYSHRRPPKVLFYAVSKKDKKVYQVQDSKYKPTYRK